MDFLKTLLPKTSTSSEKYKKTLQILKEVHDALNTPNPDNKWWIVVVDANEFEEEAFFGPEEKAREYFISYRPFNENSKEDQQLINRMITRIKARARFGNVSDLSSGEKDLASKQGIKVEPKEYTNMRINQLQKQGISETQSFLDSVKDDIMKTQITEDIMNKHGDSVLVFLNNVLKHFNTFYGKLLNNTEHPAHHEFVKTIFDLCDALYVYKARYHQKGVTALEKDLNFNIDLFLKKIGYKSSPNFTGDDMSERSLKFIDEIVDKYNS